MATPKTLGQGHRPPLLRCSRFEVRDNPRDSGRFPCSARRVGSTVRVDDARKRIVVVTDREHGTLRSLARDEGLVTFDLPRDVGGRYSVLTPVGLLPFAIAGLDIRSMLQGAAEQRTASLGSPAANETLQYCCSTPPGLSKRQEYRKLLTSYEPCLRYVGEWWKQLFGESEGKDGKGIFPASAEFTTDLHSLDNTQVGSRSC